MNLNKRVYPLVNKKPVKIYEYENKKVEIHFLNTYPHLQNYFEKKRQITAWTFIDNTNLKFLIEKGYYQTIKPLFSREINKHWANFWPTYMANNKKSTRIIILLASLNIFIVPLAGIMSPFFVLVNIILMFKIRKHYKQKNHTKHFEIVQEIIKILGGEEQFFKLSTLNQNYTDKYFQAFDERKKASISFFPNQSEEENAEVLHATLKPDDND